MRVFITTVFAAAFLALAPFSSADAAKVGKVELSEILTDKGYNVQDHGPNRVLVNVAGYSIIVAIDGADGDITYITWLSGVSGNDLGYKFLNSFNNAVKFGRAYVDRDGDVTIQMDRNSAGGVSAENIESDFDVFLLLISKFLSDLEAETIA